VLRSTISTVNVSALVATIIAASHLVSLVSPSHVSRSTLAVVVGKVVVVSSTVADVGMPSTVLKKGIVVAVKIRVWSSSIPIAIVAWVVTRAIGASIAVVATSKASHSVIIVDGGRTIEIQLPVPLSVIVSGRRIG
jgi:hypothetical protein